MPEGPVKFPTTPEHARSRARWVPLALGALLMVPFLVALVGLRDREWFPTSDDAVIELRTRDVPSEMPTSGVYSRYGFRHPGPALFVTLAGPYRLLGPNGLIVGALLVNGSATAAMSWVLYRRGGLPLLLWGGLVLAVLVRALSSQLIDPWNPWISLLPFGLAVLLAWSVLCDDWWCLPALAVVGSWVVQVHVGYSLVVLVLFGLAGWHALCSLLRRRRERSARSALRRGPVVASVAGLAVLWSLPIVGEMTRQPGNLRQLISYFRSPTEPAAGWAKAAGTFAREVGITSGWITGRAAIDPFLGETFTTTTLSLVPLGLCFAGATVLAWRYRRTDALKLQGTVAAVAITGYVAVARISGPTYPYLFRWLWVLAALAWLGCGWSVLEVAVAEWRRARWARWGVRSSVAAVLVAVVFAASALAGADLPEPEKSRAISVIGGSVADAVAGRGLVLVRFEGSAFGEYQSGLVAELERRGIPAAVPDDRVVEFGEHRVLGSRVPGVVVTVVAEDVVDTRGQAGQDPIAVFDPLTPEERAEYTPLRYKIAAAYDDAMSGRPVADPPSPAERARAEELRRRGERLVVYLDG
ncbi:MAG: hypothetical protein N2037_06755 [Acidimicrobiales bacterium]|nr:hypothetical protein [Acidimicrobiales bacterium]